MEISEYTSQFTNSVQLAVQQQVLGAMKMQGAQMVELIEVAPSPAIGSVNGPSQGNRVDAFA